MKNRLLPFICASFFMVSAVFATININTASEGDFKTLHAIGPSRAKAIVDYRNQHGQFNSIEEIKKVPGIKAGVYDKIKKDIAVSGENVPPGHKQEGFATRTGKAIDNTKETAKERTSSMVRSSADYVEKKAKAVKDRNS